MSHYSLNACNMLSGPLYYFIANGSFHFDLSYDLVAYSASGVTFTWPYSLMSNTSQWSPDRDQFDLEEDEEVAGVFLSFPNSPSDALACLTNLVSAYATVKDSDISDLRAMLLADGCPSDIADNAAGLAFLRNEGIIQVTGLIAGRVIRFASLAMAVLCLLNSASIRYPVSRKMPSSGPGPGPGPGPEPSQDWTPVYIWPWAAGYTAVPYLSDVDDFYFTITSLVNRGVIREIETFNPDDPNAENDLALAAQYSYYDELFMATLYFVVQYSESDPLQGRISYLVYSFSTELITQFQDVLENYGIHVI